MNTSDPAARAARTAPSVKRELIVLAASLAIPLFALELWGGFRDYEKAREDAEINALGFADATSRGMYQFLQQTEELMMARARQFGEDIFETETCGRQVDTITNLFPFLTNAVVIGPDGSIICSDVEPVELSSATNWPWWNELRERLVFAVGEPTEGTITDGWSLPVVAPLPTRSGDFNGALVGSIGLVSLGTYFGINNLPDDYLATVASSDRVVIARSEDAENRVGQRLPALSGSERTVGPGRAVASGPDINGVDRTWGQVELRSGWIIYIGVPDEDVLGPARREWLTNLGITLLVLLLAFSLAGHSYREIAGALAELGQRTRRMAEGEPVSVPEGTPSEVVEVVARFNQTMAEREKAQRGERRARERYQSIFDNMVFGVYVSTHDGRFIEVNPALVSMLGYDSTEDLLESGPPALYADPAMRDVLVAETLASGEVVPREVDWLRADGHPIRVRLTGRLIRGQDGDRVFQMLVQDVTEARRTEDELRQRQKMEAVGQLAGGIAHDFNNLLTVIQGNVELLQGDIPADDPLRRDLEEISRATARATSLTRRLLTLSSPRPEGGAERRE